MSLEPTLPTPRYLIVEGPIGVGKTTLVHKLAERFQARTVLEIFEENPFLADFYADRGRYAFQTEMFFLLSRYRQQEEFAQDDLFTRLWVSDYILTKCRIFASLTLSEPELALYDRVYSVLAPRVPKPDVVISLTAPLDVLLGRIRKRGRSYEQDMDPDYLDQLRRLYAQFFQHYQQAPLLQIDTSDIDFTQDQSAVDEVMRQATEVFRASRKAGERERAAQSFHK